MNNVQPVSDNNDAFIPVTTQTWNNDRHVVRCVKVIQETANVKTFCLMADQPVMFFFKPGQFVTLELMIGGEPVFRSYTISSSPSVPYSFSITVKQATDGLVSNWLHENLTEGEELIVHGPVGQFNSIDYPADKVLFLSAGVGITPVMSMARWYYHTNADVDMIFVHNAHTPADIIFKRELDMIDSRIENFQLYFICGHLESGQVWAGMRGLMDEQKLLMAAPDLLEREIFCCGPEGYMKLVRDLLKKAGFDMSHYHQELFGPTPEAVEEEATQKAEEAAELELSDVGETLNVAFSETGKSIRVNTGETIHAAAAKLGMFIPKACGVGICGTCKVRCRKGKVNMQHNGGITDEDVADGYVLACCSVPEEDVVIEY